MKYLLLLLLVFSFLSGCDDQTEKKIISTEVPTDTVRLKPAFTSITACIFSEIAYCNNPQQLLDKYLPQWKIVWNPLAVGGNYAFVATNDTVYAIAFRGSLIEFSEDAFSNWIYNDLNVATQNNWSYSSTSNAKISQGSYIGWQNLEKMKDQVSGKKLWEFLSATITDETPLMLTGHSLGGNLATIYASYLAWKFHEMKQPKNNISVVTFAAPAAGNESFADDFNSKFQGSLRFENTNDIVPKFPCSNKLAKLGDLYAPSLSASDISIGYKNITTKLSTVFTMLSTAMVLLEFQNGSSNYSHTCGDGNLITLDLSGKNTINNAGGWFAEAGYQHSMAQYATSLGAPVINCE